MQDALIEFPSGAESATPEESQPLLAAAERSLGFVPNMYKRMALSPALFGAYSGAYESFRKHATLTPAEQEVVLLAISRYHGCEYCVSAHSWIAANVSKTPADSVRALRDGEPLPDAKLEALSRFARVMAESRGRPGIDELERLRAAGYSDRQVLDIIAAIGVKVMSNYINHIYETPVDAAFAATEWRAAAVG